MSLLYEQDPFYKVI